MFGARSNAMSDFRPQTKIMSNTKFKPTSSSFRCSDALKRHNPNSPLKNHGAGYVSLAHLALHSTYLDEIPIRENGGNYTIKFGRIIYSIDKDLIPTDCISPTNSIRLTICKDHKDIITAVSLLKTDSTSEHFTLELNRHFGSDQTTIDLIQFNCNKILKEGTYVGTLKNGELHGKGVLTYSNGSKYEGEWKDGKAHSKGVCTYSDGTKYEGEWKDGKIHGNGVYTGSNGIKYEGEWKDGKRHGNGVFTLPDGSRYEGEWKDGKIHGKGVCTLPDGSRYEGEWKDGKIHGNSVYTYSDGDSVNLVVSNGKIQEVVLPKNNQLFIKLVNFMASTNYFQFSDNCKTVIIEGIKTYGLPNIEPTNPNRIEFIKNICRINFTNPNIQKCIISAFIEKYYTPDEIDHIIRSMLIIDHSILNTIIMNMLIPEPIFGEFEKYMFANGEVLVGGYNITACLEDIVNGSIGVIRGINGQRYLLVYDDKSEAPEVLPIREEMPDGDKQEKMDADNRRRQKDFEDFLSLYKADTRFSYLYAPQFNNLHIYKLQEQLTKCDLTRVSAEYQNYPSWIKELCCIYSLNKEDYASKRFIESIFEFIKNQANIRPADKLEIEQCILRIFEGGGAYRGTLGATLSKKFNEMLPLDISDAGAAEPHYVRHFDVFWNKADQDDKMRLIYLFLSLASSNGLGFGHGGGQEDDGKNESNQMFYALSTVFLRKLCDEYTQKGEVIPAIISNIAKNCEYGLCAGNSAILMANSYPDSLNNFWVRSSRT